MKVWLGLIGAIITSVSLAQTASIADLLSHHGRYIPLEVLRSQLPSDPFQALQYLTDLINSSESKTPSTRSLRLKIETVESLPDGELSAIHPVFDSEGNFQIKISLRRSHANNPVVLLEILAHLKALTNLETLTLNTMELTKTTKTVHVYMQDKDGNYLKNDKGHFILDPSSPKTIHTHELMTQFILDFLGLRSAPVLNGQRPLSWAELKMNAAGGSRLAARELAEIAVINERSARDSFESFLFFKKLRDSDGLKNAILQAASGRGYGLDVSKSAQELWADYTQSRLTQLQADLDAKTKAAQQEMRLQRQVSQDPDKKALRDRLEDQQQKLDNLVEANDREGVARLLEAFLPLEIMEPVEKKMWQDWIEAIRHPSREQSVLLFRGLDDKNDHAQTALDPNGKVVGYGFFSTLLSHNQGNYTRRLRSVATMRLRFGNSSGKEASPLVSTPKIADMMSNHAGNPAGSPFLSFTFDPQVAYNFGPDAYIVARLDKRRLMPNVASRFNNEDEILLPLMVFPDEVEYYERVKVDPTKGSRKPLEEILQRASAKIGADLIHLGEQSKSQSRQLYSEAYDVFANVQAAVTGVRQCRSLYVR